MSYMHNVRVYAVENIFMNALLDFFAFAYIGEGGKNLKIYIERL